MEKRLSRTSGPKRELTNERFCKEMNFMTSAWHGAKLDTQHARAT